MRILRTAGDRAFYRIANDCYGVGAAASALRGRIGGMMCSPEFPSAARPVLDFTQYFAPVVNGERGRMVIARGEGFAADGVSKVAYRDAAGQVVAEARVVENAYSFANLPTDLPADLAAMNSAGEVVFVQPIFRT